MTYVIIVILVIVILLLCIKIYYLRKSAGEIARGVSEWMEMDTNTLIDISSSDKYMRKLANEINRELQRLREEKIRYRQGDSELKGAVLNLSHDLRTPLTAISGYMDLLEQKDKSEDVERYLSIIADRVENMKVLTEELFRYSIVLSSNDLEFTDVDLSRVLTDALLSFYGTFKQKGIEPEIIMPEKPVIRRADVTAMTRIFSNIISNAVKYSEADFKAELKENGEIVFSNTATGLDPVMTEKLFDRFYTVENSRNSTGLGLSIAKHLTESMNGTIRAEYEKGKLYIILKFDSANLEV
ncbi:MAG: HAMP domain-containing histidine kinase [Lachnospiraceae bacterium]|nr:HAMP domain-containing histidine kinase [Lachnospiraceae bacterium]